MVKFYHSILRCMLNLDDYIFLRYYTQYKSIAMNHAENENIYLYIEYLSIVIYQLKAVSEIFNS